QDYGPVPPVPASPYAPANARNTYPYSVATARSLLAGHGWKVTPGGAGTCVRPGTGAGQCGAGIPAGTRLAFSLAYNSSSPLAGQEVHALAAAARQAGITITLKGTTFVDMIDNDNNVFKPSGHDSWAMAYIGQYTQVAYPTTLTVFNTEGANNFGSYSDP